MRRFLSLLLVLCLCTAVFSIRVQALDDPETEDRANSWRYTDGKLTSDVQTFSQRAATHPNATLQGIDVSAHQGTINWASVKAAGIDFAILRCGYGMDQTDQDDRYFEYNASECERLGIPYGVYIYSYADSVERAESEADHVLRLINGRKLSFPVYYDMEDSSTIGSNYAAIASTFCEKILLAGYPVGVYANLYWWNTYLTDDCFDNWHRWVAQYNDSCGYTGEYDMWQYSNTGSVSGISGNVDMNYLIGSPDDHGTGVVCHSYQAVVTPATCTEGGYTTHTCTRCGCSYVDTITAVTAHTPGTTWLSDESRHWLSCSCGEMMEAGSHAYEDNVCSVCGFRVATLDSRGDLNGDGEVDQADVRALLWHTLFPDKYELDTEADFNSDGVVNDADIARLLWHILIPGSFPLS